jgi:imidazolonepropionase-like amidohydrolase
VKLRLALVLCCAGACVSGETRLLKNFTLIDGSGNAPVPGAAILIVDGRIRAAGPAASIKAPPGAEVIDLTGKFIMPGIINLHGHLGNVQGLAQDPKFYTRENVENNLKTYASYGVTSVLSMGTDKPLIFELRAEQRRGRPRMARVFTAGRGFTGAGGYPTSVPGMNGVPFEVSSEAGVAKDITELAAKHPDVVKIWVDDHLGREKKIPLNLAQAIVADAHKSGLKVAAHVFYLSDAKTLAGSGLDALAHSVRDRPVDDELIRAMKAHNTYQIPTLAREASTFVFGRPAPFLKDAFFTRSVSPEVLRTLASKAYQDKIAEDPDYPKYPGFLETAKRNLKRLADAGIRYGFGTDTGPPARFQGYFEHWEMQLMVEAGLTPMQVITAASKTSAEFLGVSQDLGTLAPGRWADLMVLNQDPLSDIRQTRTIHSVYIAGNRVN